MDNSYLKNRKYAKQLIQFTGLTFGSNGQKRPTDIDGFMDFDNRHFVFIEVKHGDADLPHGQRLALERLCDACTAAGKHSTLMIGRHNTLDAGEDIDAAKLELSQLRLEGIWWKPAKQMTIREAIELFIEHNMGALYAT